MKKIYMFIMSFVVIFSLVIFGNQQSGAMEQKQNREIEELVNGLNNQGADIDEWSLYSKEEISIPNKEQFNKKLNELKAHFPEFQWEEVNQNKHLWKATAIHVHNRLNLQEKIQLITTHTNQSTTSYILYEVKGSGWNQQKWGKITSTLDSRKSLLFQGTPLNFACVKGHFNDKMESVLYNRVEEILQEFDANQIEKLTEETFVSVSAYTDNWKTVLPTKNGKMNLQIALRNIEMGGKTTVVVGTPIITTEY